MALAQVLIMANQVESARIGHQAISLTEFASNLEPEIAAGSVVEVGGALFEAAADEAIAGLGAIAVSNNVYIKLTAAGASVTASGTLVAPTWDSAKQGWYSGAERYIGGLYKDAGGNYTLKWLCGHVGNSNLKLFGDGQVGVWDGLGFLAKKVIEIGDWDMVADDFVDVLHGLTYSKIRTVNVLVRHDNGAVASNSASPSPYSFDGSQVDLWHRLNVGTGVRILRLAGGAFDNIGYDSVGYNRGWVTIEYEV